MSTTDLLENLGAATRGEVHEEPADARLMQMITGSLVSQAVYVAAKLGVADLLAAGARPFMSWPREPARTSNHSVES